MPLAIKAAAVAGTIPTLLLMVPLHDAPKMGASRGELVEHAGIVPEGGNLRQPAADNSAAARLDVVHGIDVPSRHPSRILRSDVQVLFQEGACGLDRFPGRVIELCPGMMTAQDQIGE